MNFENTWCCRIVACMQHPPNLADDCSDTRVRPVFWAGVHTHCVLTRTTCDHLRGSSKHQSECCATTGRGVTIREVLATQHQCMRRDSQYLRVVCGHLLNRILSR